MRTMVCLVNGGHSLFVTSRRHTPHDSPASHFVQAAYGGGDGGDGGDGDSGAESVHATRLYTSKPAVRGMVRRQNV